MSKRILCIVGFCVAACGSIGFAQAIPEMPQFSADDRVLIFAPHPDDETLGTAGVIQRALKNGAKVRVVCYTNGDHNEFSFIVYEKRLTFRTGEFLHMGEVRRQETVSAMTSLGLGPTDLVFLGYPDFGTLAILMRHWQENLPYRSILTRISKVAYPEALSPGAPYAGESIIKDITAVIRDFAPTKIFVSHPADTNRDHQSLYLFVRIALWDLEGQIPKPQLYPYIIHIVGWPKPRGHHVDLPLYPPAQVAGVAWKKLSLSEEEARSKEKLIDFYPSQIKYNPPYLYTYARRNELFGDFAAIRLKETKDPGLQWYTVIQPLAPAPVATQDTEGKALFSNLSYSLKEKNLFIRLKPRKPLDKTLGISIDLLGYSRHVRFELMPKLNISYGLLGLHVKNEGKVVPMPEILCMKDNPYLVFQVPLENLGDPQYVFGRVRSRATRLPLDEGAWRVIEIQ